MSTRSACMRPCMCVVVCVSSCFDVPPSAGSYHFPSTYISQREPLSSLKTKLLQVQLLTSFWILHRLAWQKFWNPPSYRHHLLLCPHHLDHLQTNFATMERRRDQHRTKDNQRQQYKKKKKTAPSVVGTSLQLSQKTHSFGLPPTLPFYRYYKSDPVSSRKLTLWILSWSVLGRFVARPLEPCAAMINPNTLSDDKPLQAEQRASQLMPRRGQRHLATEQSTSHANPPPSLSTTSEIIGTWIMSGSRVSNWFIKK